MTHFRILHRSLIALAVAGVIAAAPLSAQEINPVSLPAAQQSDMGELATYVLKVRQFAPEQVAQELRDLRVQHESGNDVATLKLAMLLAEQQNVQESEISALIQPLFEESRATKPELRAFALLVARDIQERKRMKEMLASTQNRLRDAQRGQEASEAKASQMRRQIDELQNKINAFMMMEQSILKRGR
jgi:hypothetical protein